MELPVLLGQVIANKYRVDHVIGTGGMGVVCAGFHLELDQPVAIKFLTADPSMKHEAGVRFRREAQAAAKIHSQHVVRVFDVGLFEDTVPYLVMELLEGRDLELEVETRGPLPLVEAVSYVLQAIDAIAEAHAVGIIHRDLKPTNLYLTLRSDGTRYLKVLDFGISKSTLKPRDVALTRTAAFVGSPLFMSPEQMRSARDVDTRTDIWALGAILYVLLTAHPPYSRESLPELCIAVMNEPPRPLAELMPSVPPELERIVFKCLARERTDRYGSVAELAAELVAFVPDMAEYAQRAARVLNRGGEQSSLAPSIPATSGRPAASGPAPSVEPQRRAALAGGLPGGTQSAWDKSGRRTSMGKRIPAILVAGTAVIGGVFALVSLRSKGTPASPAAPLAQSAHAANSPELAPSVAPDAAPRSSASSASEASGASTLGSSATAPASSAAGIPASPPGKAGGAERVSSPAPAINRTHSRPMAATQRAPAGSATPPSAVNIPDLGGRVF